MDLNKHLAFFNPTKLRNKEINIIGCGAVGSYVALHLAKLGIKKLTIWDFDTVEEHNITNQVYNVSDISYPKTVALERHLLKQNPEMVVIKKGKYISQPIKGIVIVAVDSLEVRNQIAQTNKYNIRIELLLDGRIGLETCQTFCVDWSAEKNIDNYLSFTQAKDKDVIIPCSPCGTELSVAPSVQGTVSDIVACIINYANGVPNPTVIDRHAFEFKIITK